MRRNSNRIPHLSAKDPVSDAVARANRARRKGDHRGESNALRLACSMEEFDAVLWTRLGDALLRGSKQHDALQALRHALWLRERSHDTLRAVVTRRLIESVEQGTPPSAAA